jgi:tRNA1Val (adenine37-N6)-methyltransferase
METTLTPFLRGRIRVHQPASGYRFNVDSVLLAGFAWAIERERVLDLGTGSAILLLLLAQWHHLDTFMGIEVQPELADLAMRNLEENGWSDRGEIRAADFREAGALPAGAFDLVVCNPPYFPAGRGQTSPDPQRALARQGFAAELPDVLSAGTRAMRAGGRLCLVLPVDRWPSLLEALQASSLHLSLVREVSPSEGAPPNRLLVQCRTEPGRGEVTLPRLVLRTGTGSYSEEVLPWMGEGAPEGPRFFCDAMVGKLARYLRLMGVDCAYARGADDGWLLDEARRTGRVLITRDRPLLARCEKAGVEAHDPESDAAPDQFAWLRRRFDLPAEKRPRCLDCNAPTLEMDRQEALGKVPPYTYLTHRRFSACPCCGKLTWEGSHLERFRRDITGELGV